MPSQIPEPFAIAWKLWPKAKLGLGLPVPAALPQVLRARRQAWRGQPGALGRKAVKLASRHRLVVDDEINLARAGLLQREEGRARGILDNPFNADEDNGYFDPRRYDSELLTLAVWDDYRDGLLYWRLEGTYGRQAFTVGAVKRDDAVSGGSVLAGVNFAQGRAAFEASYARSDYALNVAQGFTYSRTGFSFRFRF